MSQYIGRDTMRRNGVRSCHDSEPYRYRECPMQICNLHGGLQCEAKPFVQN